jgi:hypothetical protein
MYAYTHIRIYACTHAAYCVLCTVCYVLCTVYCVLCTVCYVEGLRAGPGTAQQLRGIRGRAGHIPPRGERDPTAHHKPHRLTAFSGEEPGTVDNRQLRGGPGVQGVYTGAAGAEGGRGHREGKR